MKKLALIICVLLLFSLVACADNDPEIDTPGNDENPTGAAGSDNTDLDDGTNTDANGGADTGLDGDLDDDTETLTGTAQGYGGEVTVTVMVNGDDIVSVEAMGEKETQGVGSNAIDQLPDKIEEADSTDVEAVSGATYTSNAIKEAVNKALDTRK